MRSLRSADWNPRWPVLARRWVVRMAFLGMAGASAAAGPIVLTADTPWVVPAKPAEALERALTDVQRDWYKVLGHRPIVLTQSPTNWSGAVVRFGISGEPGARESFTLRVEGRTLAATGADTRGAIYAAYALSEEVLGVDPWYFWTDHEPAPRSRIEVPGDLSREWGSPRFRYRGWFINDEDLLNSFAPDPLREGPFSLDALDHICETILRLRGNMIVPGTFNFADERCWELASRRGLALNMHHILVVGLNTYRWPKDVPFSYTKHPEVMEKYWRDCIAAFKGREVVWTVGYRGKHDQPFWTDEPELKTAEARGAVITKAIARQVELVREADPGAMIIANLWMEGAEMMHAGHLKLPEGVVQVWPDNGFGRLRDNGAVTNGQGAYYHTAMLNGGANQLSEMVPPSRIYTELGRFASAGATNYLLFNVSDVRPVPLSTDCAMRLAWNGALPPGDGDRERMEHFLADWSRREFGEAAAPAVAAIYARYFDIPYMRGDTWETCSGDNKLQWRLRNITRTKSLDRARDAESFAATNRPYVAALLSSAEPLAEKVPADRQGFFVSHVLTPIRIHLYSLEILENYASAMILRDATKAELALCGFDDLFGALRRAETGKWPAWYFGECLAGLEGNRDLTRKLLAELRGEPEPPMRAEREYPDIYRYQEPFLANFPRLYPPGARFEGSHSEGAKQR